MVPLAADVAHIVAAREDLDVLETDPLSRLAKPGPSAAVEGALPALAYHGMEKISDALLDLERRNGFSAEELRWRLAMNVADGAFFWGRTGDLVGHLLVEKQGIHRDRCAQQLCDWHGLVKLLEHSDRTREHRVQAFTQRYYTLAQRLRRAFAYGTGQKVAKAMAAAFHIAWLRPAAPQEGGTRTAAFEIQRVPPVFLNNFFVYFQSLVALLRVGPQAEKQKLAQLGQELTDPALFIFIVARYEARRPLLRFTQVAQQVHKAGFERTR